MNEIRYERLYLHCPNPCILLTARLPGWYNKDQLTAALEKATLRHALLRSRVVQTAEGRAFFEPAENRPRLTMDAGEWQAVYTREAQRPMDMESGELIRYFACCTGDDTRLTVYAHHLAGDGLSLLQLFGDIQEFLENPGKDAEPLPLRLMTAEDIPPEAKLPLLPRLAVGLLNRRWQKSARCFTGDDFLRMREIYWKNHHPVFSVRQLELGDLRQRCRDRGVSVNSAFLAALAIAAKEPKVEFSVAAAVRPGDFHGMANFSSGVSLTPPEPEADFWANARRIHEGMEKQLDFPSRRYFLKLFLGALSPTLVDGAYYAAFDGWDNPVARQAADMLHFLQPKGYSVTNLTQSRLKARELIFLPPLVPGTRNLLGLVTLGDVLSVSAQADGEEALSALDTILAGALARLQEV